MVLCLPQDTGSFGSKVFALFEGAEDSFRLKSSFSFFFRARTSLVWGSSKVTSTTLWSSTFQSQEKTLFPIITQLKKFIYEVRDQLHPTILKLGM